MQRKNKGSWPISRVLSWATIPLGCTSPYTSSNLPESNAGHANGLLFGLAPSGVYHATNCYQLRGALLPHPFTLTCAPNSLKESGAIGGLLSAALSVGSRPPGVTWHSALWSPDFPPLLTQYHLWKYRVVTAAAAWPTPGGRLPRNPESIINCLLPL